MLTDWILAFEKPTDKSFVDNRDIGRRRRIVFIEGAAHDHFGVDGFKESRHRSHIACACVFFGTGLGPALDANSVVPAIARHRRVQRRRRHSHSGDLSQCIIDLPKLLRHLLGLVSAEGRIDPRNETSLRVEAEILMLEIAQALRQQRRGRQQYQRHRCLRDHQRLLRPRAATAHRTIRTAQRFHWIGMRSHPRRRCSEDNSRQESRCPARTAVRARMASGLREHNYSARQSGRPDTKSAAFRHRLHQFPKHRRSPPAARSQPAPCAPAEAAKRPVRHEPRSVPGFSIRAPA